MIPEWSDKVIDRQVLSMAEEEHHPRTKRKFRVVGNNVSVA